MSFYLILDQMTVHGAGQTLDDAKSDACEWLCDDDDPFRRLGIEALDKMIIYEHESRHGAAGVFVYCVTDFEWPDDSGSLDGDQWYEYYWKQEENNTARERREEQREATRKLKPTTLRAVSHRLSTSVLHSFGCDAEEHESLLDDPDLVAEFSGEILVKQTTPSDGLGWYQITGAADITPVIGLP